MRGLKFYRSLKTKLIVLFFLLIFTPFVFIGSVTYRSYTRKMEENSMNYTKQLTSQIVTSFDSYLADIYRLMLVFYSDMNILQIMNIHGEDSLNNHLITSMESNRVYATLSTLAYDRPDIRGIFVICRDGAIFSNTSNNGIYNKKLADYWNQYLSQAEEGKLIIPPHNLDYYPEGKETVFSAIRIIKNSYTGKWVGIIKVDLGPKVFEKILHSSDLGQENNLIITDSKNNIFYPINKQGTVFKESDAGKGNKSQTLTSVFISKESGMKAIGLFKKDALNKDARMLVGKIMIISLFTLLTALVAAIVVSNSLVRPIRYLMNKMKQVQAGELWVKAEVKTKDELGLLTEDFNEMVNRIRGLLQEVGTLVKEVYEVKDRERSAELSALQSSINPHFLYNTLEILSMTALENNQIEICEISTSLGRLLRYTVDKQQKPVILSDELRFVEAYFKILSLRFGQRLKTSVQTEETLMECLVPKLIIQPLLENAVKHGIAEDEGTLTVIVEKDMENLVIKVIDNGCGISPEKLDELRCKIYAEDIGEQEKERFGQVRHGYALRNVHKRLRLLFGQGYGVEIESRENRGTTFILKLPCIIKEPELEEEVVKNE